MHVEILQAAYHSATKNNGLIKLTKDIRNNESIKIRNLLNLFNNLDKDWQKRDGANGHMTYVSQVTGVVVGFQAHQGNRGDNCVNSEVLKGLLKSVQKHLNILCNIIFQYNYHNWKNAPNYHQSLGRYKQWRQQEDPETEQNRAGPRR